MQSNQTEGKDVVAPIHIAHVIYRLDTGGMENGLVNIVNKLPAGRFHHTIICLTSATRFRERIERQDVEIVECHKPAGKHLPTYWRIYKELCRLQPDIVHTRNLGTIDINWVAWIVRCPWRVHGEHGWSPDDPRGLSKKYRLLRKFCDPVIDRYVAVSNDIQYWLNDVIGVAESNTQVLHNGVDVSRFNSVRDVRPELDALQKRIVFGTLGRQEPIKGLEVFLASVRDLLNSEPALRDQVRIIMAGDGPSHDQLIALRDGYGLDKVVEFPGVVSDVPEFYRSLDFFVQPSLNEGISNTVLEAMASGLPVLATNVGGNPELVRDGREGKLVPANDVQALKKAIGEYIWDDGLRDRQGMAARERVVASYSLEKMVKNYERLYCDVCDGAGTVAS